MEMLQSNYQRTEKRSIYLHKYIYSFIHKRYSWMGRLGKKKDGHYVYKVNVIPIKMLTGFRGTGQTDKLFLEFT